VAGVTTGRWSRRELAALGSFLVVGIAIRAMLLPTDGYRPDLDQFVRWVHGIAVNGLGNAYDQKLAFPPVMAYVWGALAALDPAFRTATDSADPAIRAVMKLPAVMADIGIALLVAYALRDRPRWAVVGAAVILLHPAVIDVSAWWGQYESIYMLPALAAAILAIKGRNAWAAAAIAVAVMAKPQALAFLLPFAAWFWATGGWREVVRAAIVGTGVIVALWLPFIPAGGPMDYVQGVAEYENHTFNMATTSAWNLWWLVQNVGAGGVTVRDDVAIVGPLTFRLIGLALAGWLELVVARAVLRDPRPTTLIVALIASTLVAFSFLTTMHERYAFGALVFLNLLIADPRVRFVSLAFGVAFTINVLIYIPPTAEIEALQAYVVPLGLVGSLTLLAVTGFTVATLTAGRADDAPA
jgi:Gpi18-like mannosyltransferase